MQNYDVYNCIIDGIDAPVSRCCKHRL